MAKLLKEKWVLSSIPTAYLLLFCLAPLIITLFIAFRVPGDYGGLAPLFSTVNGHTVVNLTLDNFEMAFSSKFIWLICLRSVIFALGTTILCLLVGYPIALMIARADKKRRDLLLLLIVIPFWSSFLIRIYAWMILLGPNTWVAHFIVFLVHLLSSQNINLLFSTEAVMICLVYINLPFIILPIYTNLEKHDLALIEASRDLGASRLKTFWQITWPLSLPGIMAGSALVFIPSIGMFVVPELLGNTCSLMVGNLIKEQFLTAMNWPLGSVTAIMMTALVLLIAYVVNFFVKRTGGMKYGSK